MGLVWFNRGLIWITMVYYGLMGLLWFILFLGGDDYGMILGY